MGDSMTYGFSLPRSQVWTALCAARTGAEMVNHAINGNTTGGMLAALRHELESVRPDAVVLMGGGNDLIYGGDLAGAKSNMGAMVHIAASACVQPFIGIPPQICPPVRQDWAVWLEVNGAERLMEEYSAWLRQMCQTFRLPVIDFADGFTSYISENRVPVRDLYLEDGLHPAQAGHALMSDIAAKAILSH